MLFSAKLAVRLTERGGRRDAQKLLDVLFDVFSDAKELRRHVNRVDDSECGATERTYDALYKEGFQREKLRRAGKSRVASAVLYKKFRMF